MKHRITDIIARVLIFIPALAVIITSVSFPGYVPSYNSSVYDINGDGEVTDTDVKYVLALSASLSSDIPSEIKLSADVNGDSIACLETFVVIETGETVLRDSEHFHEVLDRTFHIVEIVLESKIL